MNSERSSDSGPESTDRDPGRWRMTPFRWLLVAIVAYFAVSLTLSWLRAVELQTSTWDLGVYQQALWTTAHGRTFYETADVETGGYASLLEIHSAFLLYALVPLYGLFPAALTLFVVQSAAVALAAIPLYFLARDTTASPWLGLFAGLVYLTFTGTLSSNLYDFHPEAFLPIEIFALVALWNRGRYAAGFAVALAAFLTFEFAPVLVFSVAIFALLPPTLSLGRGAPLRTWDFSALSKALRGWMESGKVHASLALAVSSVVAYVVLFVVRVDLLPSLLGSYPHPVAVSGYFIGVTPASLGLAWGNLSIGLGTKLSYWLLLLGLLAFVPVLAPRALLLTLPWFLFTLFSADLSLVTLGFQYGFIAGSTLLVAFAFGLPLARRAAEAWVMSEPPPAGRPSVGPRRPSEGRRLARVTLVAGVVGLLALNVALTPADPAMENFGDGAAYRVSWDVPPDASNVVRLAGLVPPDATVLTTDDLFSLVANDVHAYSLSVITDPALTLPFSPADPPTYVFLSEARSSEVVSWLTEELYDRSAYGVRGIDWSSPAGSVLLFESGYSGPVTVFGPTPPLGGVYDGGSLAASTAGFPTTTNGSAFPSVVESDPGEVGLVWSGPGISLAAGNYTVSLSLRVVPLPGFAVPSASTPVLEVDALGFAEPSLYEWGYPFNDVDSRTFESVSFAVVLPAPTLGFSIQGILLDSSVQVTLNYFEVAPE